jgi:hypothetical protein
MAHILGCCVGVLRRFLRNLRRKEERQGLPGLAFNIRLLKQKPPMSTTSVSETLPAESLALDLLTAFHGTGSRRYRAVGLYRRIPPQPRRTLSISKTTVYRIYSEEPSSKRGSRYTRIGFEGLTLRRDSG